MLLLQTHRLGEQAPEQGETRSTQHGIDPMSARFSGVRETRAANNLEPS